MCCGNYDGPKGEAMSDDMPAMAKVMEGPMAKVFTTVPGMTVRIGNHGVASNDEPAMVPAEVAEELLADPAFRIEKDEAAEPVKLPVSALKRASKGIAPGETFTVVDPMKE